MFIISFLTFIMFPILSIIISIIGYIFDYKKHGVFYSILFGLSIGLIVYYYVPMNNYDLYRSHLVVEQLYDKSLNEAMQMINNFDMDIIPYIYSFFISKLGNFNYQQLFVVAGGYTIILYILQDYRKNNNIKPILFIFTTLFTLFGFNTLYFISGLWFYISILIFALAFYFDYYKNKTKLLCYILYFSSIFIHNAVFFALIILFIYKLFGNKFNFKSLITTLILLLIPIFILQFINSIVDIGFISSLTKMTTVYFEKNDYMHRFYGGSVFIIEISKFIMVILAIFIQKKRKKMDDINGYILLLGIAMLVMLPKSIVMIRFIMLIQFIGIIPLLDYYDKIKTNNIILIIIMIILIVFYVMYFYKTFQYENFSELCNEGLVNNIFYYLKEIFF